MTTLRISESVGDGFDFVDFSFGLLLSLALAPPSSVNVDQRSNRISLTFPGSSTVEEFDEVGVVISGSFNLFAQTGPISSIEYTGDGRTLVEYTDLNIDLRDYFNETIASMNAFSSYSFFGTSNNDVIGNDGLGSKTINALGGNDIVAGSPANDVVRGGDGDDIMIGEGGADLLNGGGGVDTVDYGSETGFSGVAVNISGGSVTDTRGARDQFISVENVIGTRLDDTLFGDGAANRLEGGDGDDSINAKGGDDVVLGGEGNDTLVGGTGDDRVEGASGDDVLGGRGGDDILLGQFGNDRIFGQLGDDTIEGHAGDDVINGGQGDADIDGGQGADDIRGRDGDDVIQGGDGADRIDGGTGVDTIDGGVGDDTLIGGAGADVFLYDASGFGDDQLFRFAYDVDKIQIDSSLAADFDALTITEALVDGNAVADTVISFGGGSVTLMNRAESGLDADDFIFV